MQAEILKEYSISGRFFKDDEPDSEVGFETDEEDLDSLESSDEEKAEQADSDDGEWKASATAFTPPPFVIAPGPSRAATHGSSPLDFFRLFVTLEVVDQMRKATNAYGTSLFTEDWVNTDRKEMDRFFAAVIYMGIHRSPTLKSYWAADSKSPFLASLFPSRDRFLQLYRSFYIAAGQRDPGDMLWHVRPLVDSLTKSFPLHMDPPRILIVDEALVHCKARSTMKQYIRAKPHRWGYKVWCLVSDGYLLRFSVYLGKRGQENGAKPSQVAERLVKPYYGLNHLVVTDNWYTSPALFQTFLRNSTFALGTTLANRKGFPRSLVPEVANFARFQWSFRQNDKLVAYAFFDRKPVYLLSTVHPPTQTSTIDRRDKTGESHAHTVPTAVKDYTSLRGGVDTIDQLQSY